MVKFTYGIVGTLVFYFKFPLENLDLYLLEGRLLGKNVVEIRMEFHTDFDADHSCRISWLRRYRNNQAAAGCVFGARCLMFH